MSFKDDFYARYVSTHTGHRKGAATLDRFRAKLPGWDLRFGHFLPEDRNAAIVDIGCGNGNLVFWLQQRGYTAASGIDMSVEQVAVAHGLGVLRVEVADLRVYLVERMAHFDVIFLRDVIEHFTREEVLQILDLVRAALKPGGRVVLQLPNGASPFIGRVRYGDFTHELAYTQSSLAQLFGITGFREACYFPVAPRFHGLRSLPRVILWKSVEAFYRLLLYAELGRGDYVVTQNLVATAIRSTA